ncbi:MAG: glycosyltransferase family 4 protein [Saprospiraceae bacterium]|nr:glycosyltransferase family 4 protein [Saprospiraceae bacterium]
MHILMIPSWFQPASEGHQGIFVRDMAQAMVREGHEVRIIAFSHNQIYREFEADGITEIYCPGPESGLKGKLTMPSKMYRQLEDYVGKFGPPDIINTHGLSIIRLVYRWAHNRKVPIAHHEHLHLLAVNNPPVKYRLLARYLYPKVNVIIGVSNILSGGIRRLTQTPVVTLPPVVHEDFFQLKSDKPPLTIFQFACVGDLDQIKGHRLLIEALGAVRRRGLDFKLHVAGDGPIRRELEILCDRENLSDYIIWYGRQSRPSICRILSGCHIYCTATELETFGLHIAEAMAAGLYIVSTDCGGVRDYVDGDSGTIVVRRTVEALADAIETAMLEYRADNCKENQDRIRKYASAPVVIPRIIEVFRSCIRSDVLHQ